MKSKLQNYLKLKYTPVAVLFTNEKPEDALMFKPGKWGCVQTMMNAAIHGKTAAFTRTAAGCLGGEVGLGFGNAYPKIHGGADYFLSVGRGGYLEGERYKASPQLAQKFIDQLPYQDIEEEYVVFMPITEVPEDTEPEVIVMYVTADQLASLVILANYDRPGIENVIAPGISGCQSTVLLPYTEGKKEQPSCVIGMFDMSARPHIDANMLSFSMPYKRFLEMEANSDECFFHTPAWQKIATRL